MKRKKAKRTQHTTSNQRVDVAPEGGHLAALGLYTPAVQKVWNKWKDRIKPEALERYFFAVASAVIFHKTELDLPGFTPRDWPAVFELGSAIAAVVSDNNNVASWLLGGRYSAAINGHRLKWNAIAADIKEKGGPQLEGNAIKQAAKRLRILTPPMLAKDYLETRPEAKD